MGLLTEDAKVRRALYPHQAGDPESPCTILLCEKQSAKDSVSSLPALA